MDNRQRKQPTPASDPGATTIAERRRIGRVVHDDRGNARLEWTNAPPDAERVTLSIEETQPSSRPECGYDPYQSDARSPRRGPQIERSAPDGRTAKRDLRKLSEWIKQMRELEARKQRGDD